jgi:hypothetical protein
MSCSVKEKHAVNRKTVTKSAVWMFLGLSMCAGTLAAKEDDRLAESRALAQRFSGELMQVLTEAIQSRGAAEAIVVCKEEAPRIARRLSDESGAIIGRTSLKTRNPANAPEPWQRQILERFARQRAGGKEASSLEHFERMEDGGARYMRGIGTQPLCLACHGSALAPDVRETLARLYPQDAATGFSTGDLRGALSIIWPAEEKDGADAQHAMIDPRGR